MVRFSGAMRWSHSRLRLKIASAAASWGLSAEFLPLKVSEQLSCGRTAPTRQQVALATLASERGSRT